MFLVNRFRSGLFLRRVEIERTKIIQATAGTRSGLRLPCQTCRTCSGIPIYDMETNSPLSLRSLCSRLKQLNISRQRL